MEVISHDDKGVHPPAEPNARYGETAHERCCRPFAAEHRSAVVASIDDMVTRATEFDSNFSRHVRQPHYPGSKERAQLVLEEICLTHLARMHRGIGTVKSALARRDPCADA